MGAAAFITLFALLLTTSGSPNPAHAQDSPSATVSLSDVSVEQGTAITATMSFGGLTRDSDRSTTDYIFRADVKDSADQDADDCEGGGMGRDRNINRVDEDPEIRSGTIPAGCPAGDYTIEVSISSSDNTELASASAQFTIIAPTVGISLSPDAVEEGNEITAAMSFGGLTSDSNTSTTDYIFRADVKDSEDDDADGCEGSGLGVDRNINRVDEDPETRTGTISADCPAGPTRCGSAYRPPAAPALASASAGFFILRPPVAIEPPTLTALSVSQGDPAVDVALSPAFDSGTLEYSADVDAERITIAPTAGDAAIAYLDGNGDAIADADGTADGQQVDLGAGSNTVRVAVSRDGLTTTYTLTLFRLVTQQQSSTTNLVDSLDARPQSQQELSAGQKRAQGFTTGTIGLSGYEFVSADLWVSPGSHNDAGFEVSLWSSNADGTAPGRLLSVLNHPESLGEYNANFPLLARMTFTAPWPVLLEESTTYFVVAHRKASGSSTLLLIRDNETVNTEHGFSQSGDHDVQASGSSSWTSNARALLLRVKGTLRNAGGSGISSMKFTSDAGSDHTYVSGNFIVITVGLSDNVDVVGTPQLAMWFDGSGPNDAAGSGGGSRHASYYGGRSNTNELTFGYSVQADDIDRDGASVNQHASAFVFDAGESIRYTTTVNDAELGQPGILNDRQHRVVGTVETVTLSLSADSVAEDSGTAVNVTATVSAAQVQPATDSAYTLSSNTTLSFAANATESTGAVTVTPVDNSANDGDKIITVSGTVDGVLDMPGSRLLRNSNDVTLTITDDEMPVSDDATLNALSLSGVTFTPTFGSGTTTYTASVLNSVSSTTVTATPNHADASAVVTPADADSTATGHQVSLEVGDTDITVEVTAQDGNTTQTYTVTVTRAAAAQAERRHAEGADAESHQHRQLPERHHQLQRERRQLGHLGHRHAHGQSRLGDHHGGRHDGGQQAAAGR